MLVKTVPHFYVTVYHSRQWYERVNLTLLQRHILWLRPPSSCRLTLVLVWTLIGAHLLLLVSTGTHRSVCHVCQSDACMTDEANMKNVGILLLTSLQWLHIDLQSNRQNIYLYRNCVKFYNIQEIHFNLFHWIMARLDFSSDYIYWPLKVDEIF